MKKIFLAALAVIGIGFVGTTDKADAKPYDVNIDGKQYTVEYGARPADTTTSWKLDGHTYTYVWASAEWTAVDLYIDGKLQQPAVAKKAKKAWLKPRPRRPRKPPESKSLWRPPSLPPPQSQRRLRLLKKRKTSRRL